MTRYLYGGDVEIRAGVKSPRLAAGDSYRVSTTEPTTPADPQSAGVTLTTDLRTPAGATLPAGQVVDSNSQLWVRGPEGHTGRLWVSVASGPWTPLNPVDPRGPRFVLTTSRLPDGAVPAVADTGQAVQSLANTPTVLGGAVKLTAPGVSYHMPAQPLPGNVLRVGCRVTFDNGTSGSGSATYGAFSTPTLASPTLSSSAHVVVTPTAWIFQVIKGGSGTITVVSAATLNPDNTRFYEVWSYIDPVNGVALSLLPDGRLVRSEHPWIKEDCRYPFFEDVWNAVDQARPAWADAWADDQRSGWEAGPR